MDRHANLLSVTHLTTPFGIFKSKLKLNWRKNAKNWKRNTFTDLEFLFDSFAYTIPEDNITTSMCNSMKFYHNILYPMPKSAFGIFLPFKKKSGKNRIKITTTINLNKCDKCLRRLDEIHFGFSHCYEVQFPIIRSLFLLGIFHACKNKFESKFSLSANANAIFIRNIM